MSHKWLIILVFVCSAELVRGAAPIRIALSSAPSNLSPFFSTDANSQNINRLVHISLTDFSETMNFECRLCESFSEKVENNKHHIRFKLQQNIKFWDGSKVTAVDVEKSWKYFVSDKNIKSVFRFSFENIEKVIVHAPFDVELVYKQFSLGNLSDLALLKVIKLKNLNSDGSAIAKPNYDEIIGAGPYRFGKVSRLQVILKPMNKERPELQFKVVKDETTLALKLINNEVDLSLASISPRKLHWLKSRKENNLSFWERSSSTFNYMGINHKKPLFSDVRVRRAISLLIPREKILKYKLKNTAVLSSGMFSPAFVDLYPGKTYDRNDTVEAARLFKAVGFTKDEKGILSKNGKPFSIDWKVSNNKATLEIVHTLKSYFENAGIIVNVIIQEWGTFFRGIKQGKFDIMVGRWIGFTGPDMLKRVFHSSSRPPKGANRGGYVNKKLDISIDLATSETDKAKRNRHYIDVLKMANNDYAYINLWHPNIIWVGRKCLSNIKLHPNGSFHPLLEMGSSYGK